jgi:hypothetical protein
MVNGHSNSTLGGTRTNAKNVFDASRGRVYPAVGGMAQQMYVGSGASISYPAYHCAPCGGPCCCVITTNGWYGGVTLPVQGLCAVNGDYAGWYTDNAIGGAQGPGSMAHKFTCSKCHTPHAAGLPALLVHNCVDTGLATPAVGTTDLRAVNCHRKTSTADGWHRLAPGQ